MNEMHTIYLDRCRDLIAAHGHMVQHVAGQTAFSYTAGLTPILGYEIMTVGLPPEFACAMLNDLAGRLQEGPIDDAVNIDRIANVHVRMRTWLVNDTATGRRRRIPISIALALGYQPNTFRQMVWPDQNGHFPGDGAYGHPCSQDVDEIAGFEAITQGAAGGST